MLPDVSELKTVSEKLTAASAKQNSGEYVRCETGTFNKSAVGDVSSHKVLCT